MLFRSFGQSLIDRAKAARNDQVEPALAQELNEYADALQRLGEEHGELASAFRTYRSILATRGLLDFGDQVFLAHELLKNDPLVLARARDRHQWILVDEYQDTNRLQGSLVDRIASGSRNLTAVGDDDQSIYRFRGAALGNILGFVDRYPDTTKVVLTKNYRSTAPILRAARSLIRYNDPERLEVKIGISKDLVAVLGAPTSEPVAFRRFRTTADEADWIANEIAASVASGRALRDHAVLLRAHVDAGDVTRSLNMAQIAWR